MPNHMDLFATIRHGNLFVNCLTVMDAHIADFDTSELHAVVTLIQGTVRGNRHIGDFTVKLGLLITDT
jgi:hypothetical protein